MEIYPPDEKNEQAPKKGFSMIFRDLIDYFIIRFSGLFDSRYYLKNNRDVRQADIDPLWHFVKFGWREGRNPSEVFDTCYYLETNRDVSNANVNPLTHYIRYGKKEERRSSRIDAHHKLSPASKAKSNIFNKISKENFRKVYLYGKKYGIASLLIKLKTTILFNYHSEVSKERTDLTIHESLIKVPVSLIEDEIKPYEIKVSIIIPTKNAGDMFELILKMLINQKGFKEVEIVIVDSGSNDNTVQLSNKYNAKVINISPDSFSHSYARNLGAENASGDYLLFTVQDALPPTTTWLYDLMTVLLNNDVSAVSCAEFPREDADLFYRVISWNHYNFLGVNERDRILKLPAVSDYVSLRQNGQLSDIACLMPIGLFNQYKYRFNYAEDLDLGIRLIKDGKKIAFLGSTRIIHSHNRPASYFLKRGYVDNLFLSDMFSDFPIPKINFAEFLSDIFFTFEYLNDVIVNNISSVQLPQKFEAIEAIIRDGFKSVNRTKHSPVNDLSNYQFVDEEYKYFLETLLRYIEMPKTGEQYNGFLMDSLMNYTNIMLAYLRQSYELIDSEMIEEINICMNKELAILIGSHLAYCYRKDPKNAELGRIHADLIMGV